MVELWLGLFVGLLARWGDRIEFVVTEEQGRTWRGFLARNWVRLGIRLGVSAYVFRLLLQEGWIVAEPIAFSVGVSMDTITESFVDRAKKTGERIIGRLRPPGGTP